jgi:transcriptional regulator with XRE-family HTH domain
MNPTVSTYRRIIYTPMRKFTEWLNEELQKRDWSYNELARRAGLSSGGISLVMNEARKPGPELCLAIARALNKDPVTVFRLAGLLPPEPDGDPDAKQALHLFRQLSPTQKEMLLTQMEALARRKLESRPSAARVEEEP